MNLAAAADDAPAGGGAAGPTATATATVTLPDGRTLPALGFSAYDVVVCGTGLTECVLAGLLATGAGDGDAATQRTPLRVLMLDRNPFYGGASASLHLEDLFKRFEGRAPTVGEIAGASGGGRDVHAFSLDLTPKFIMGDGALVKIIQKTGADRYLDFMQVDGSYAVRKGTLHKVPASAQEALKTSLVGFLQKRYLRSFLKYVEDIDCDADLMAAASGGGDDDTPAAAATTTIGGIDLATTTARQLLVDKHWCDEKTCEFVGHCVALHTDDGYLDRPALETVRGVRLYGNSLRKFGTSPYLYPEYGLGGLSEAFARLCSIHGGDFMLSRDLTELVCDPETGRVVAVVSTDPDTGEAQAATVGAVVGDPSYFGAVRRKQVGSVIRCICVLRGPVPGLGKNAESAQIIIPRSQCRPKRQHDIYCSVVGNRLRCTPEGIFSATISTVLESNGGGDGAGSGSGGAGGGGGRRAGGAKNVSGHVPPAAMAELATAIAVVGGEQNILRKFVEITPVYEPADDGTRSRVFVSRSCDATSHFESTTADIKRIFKRLTGRALDLSMGSAAAGENAGESKSESK